MFKNKKFDWNYFLNGSNIFLTGYIGTGTEVTVPGKVVIDGNTYNVVTGINKHGFDTGCIRRLKYSDNVKLPDDCTRLFANDRSNCNLVFIDFGNIDTSNVTSMLGMFCGCRNLEYLNVSGFDTSNVVHMEFMFASCNALKTLDLSGFDTSKVVSMLDMFTDCCSLESLNVSNFDTANVIRMCDMFSDCRSLRSLDLSSFDTSNVHDTRAMFRACENLKHVYISDKWNMNNIRFSDRMFAYCKNLPNYDPSKNEFLQEAKAYAYDSKDGTGYLERKTFEKEKKW